jgi:hypothetical protein
LRSLGGVEGWLRPDWLGHYWMVRNAWASLNLVPSFAFAVTHMFDRAPSTQANGAFFTIYWALIALCIALAIEWSRKRLFSGQ